MSFFTPSFTAILVLAGIALPLADAATVDNDLAGLAVALRPIIVGLLPDPLYEKSDNWGHTTMGLDRIKWRRLRPQVIKAPKNDGTWRKTRVTARDPKSSLEFRLGDFKPQGTDQQTFKAFLALTVSVDHEEEIWEKGVRLYRDTTEARVRIKANLDIETTIRLETKADSILPDTVFRLRVTKADVSYDNMVVEHIAGIGGTGARWVGEALRSTLKQWNPSIERELLAKADAAIIKAADTREVRISLRGLLSK
jgi:hypothetical protein